LTPDSAEIEKSSRHQKIIGNLGEQLVCNWLSRSGFEVAIIDHTGIDLIAFDSKNGKRMGITVKSRTRQSRETESVNIFNNRKNDYKKIKDACKAFDCEPWIAIYVETRNAADLYLTSLSNYEKKYKSKTEKAIDDWKMTPNWKIAYSHDPAIMHLTLMFEAQRWFTHDIF
jgi:hypothetical protein